MQFGKIRREDASSPSASRTARSSPSTSLAIPEVASLAELLHTGKAVEIARELIDPRFAPEPLGDQMFLAPIDRQEVWAAGVTYKRSKVAREEESRGAAQFYDKVYTADRPELFLKATPERVVDPGEPVRVRADSKWTVPEPELALVIDPAGTIVGYTIGNDMSARDIEGENPLYLPQAKIYRGSCAVGPLITPVGVMPALAGVEIRLVIDRGGRTSSRGGRRWPRWRARRRAWPTGCSGRTSIRTERCC